MTKGEIDAKLAALRGDDTVTMAWNTRRLYSYMWRQFEGWCDANGFQSMPAQSHAVVGWLFHLFETGKSHSTILAGKNCVATRHRLAGEPRPTQDRSVRDCVRLLRRKRLKGGGKPPRQAIAVRLSHIDYFAEDKPLEGEPYQFTPKEERRHVMDCAVLYVMHSAFLRIQEAADLRWRDVEWAGGRAKITIRSSKTNLEPATATLSSKASDWLARIRKEEARPEDRVFRVRHGRSLADRIARAMQRVRPGATGHSLRVGAAQDATLRGVPLQRLMVLGRWTNLDTPARYAKEVTADFDGANIFEDE